jgi:hypothetical protein
MCLRLLYYRSGRIVEDQNLTNGVHLEMVNMTEFNFTLNSETSSIAKQDGINGNVCDSFLRYPISNLGRNTYNSKFLHYFLSLLSD